MKIILRTLLALLVLLLVLLLALGSETVNRWLFDQAEAVEPRLELAFVGGDLWHGWQFERIAWSGQGLELTIDQLDFAWSPSCLFGARLCIDRLYSHAITVISEPSAEPEPSEPFSLPQFTLPLSIELGDVRIDQISLDGESTLLSDLVLQADASGDQLNIREFSGAGPDLDWHLSGALQMQGDWPLMLAGRINLPPVDEREWWVDLDIAGELKQQLTLQLQSDGYLKGTLSGEAAVLDSELPASLHWQGDSFLAMQSLPEGLTLNNLQLDVHGSLEEGFAVQAGASLPGQGGEIQLQLSALAQTTGVSDAQLLLYVSEAPERKVELKGQANWQDELTADAELRLQQAFPWYWLYPQDLGDVELQQLDMQASLQGEQIDSELTAKLNGVAGQSIDLQATVAGTQQALNITPLRVDTPAGSAEGSIDLVFTPTLAWNGEFQLRDLNPGIFVAELPGQLNGSLNTEGSQSADTLQVQANWDIDGTLRQQPLALQGRVNKGEATWDVNDLLIRQGENRISGQGQWGEQVNGNLDIRLNQLATLWPELRGVLTGQVNLSGTEQAPGIQLSMEGSDLGYAAVRVDALNLSGRVRLSDELPGNAQISAQGLRSGDSDLGNLVVQAEGNKTSHNLALDLSEGLVDATVRLRGNLNEQRWQGRLTQSSLAYRQFDWTLQEGADLQYQLSAGRLQLSEHCWQHADARLCFNGQQTLMPERKIDLALTDFDLGSLRPWMPDDIDWEAMLNAQIEFNQAPGKRPTADVRVSSANGVIQVREDEQSLDFPYELIEFTTQLRAAQADTQLIINSESIGQLEVQAQVQDPAGQQTLRGNYQIAGFKLDFLRPFVPQAERFEGQLNGQGELSGQLVEPVINGQLRLSDGHVSGPSLPISLEQLSAEILIQGQQARIDGDWRSGERGTGSLSGVVGWAPVDIDLTLQGDALPVTVEPYADLFVSPDLDIALRDNALQVTGKIAVPEGDISVRELPPQAVKVSPDTVIVGQEKKEESESPLAISARVQLIIGDQLRLSAFGLTGRLKGQLTVQENMTANGDLRILDGRIKRLGQDLKLRRALLLFSGPISQPYMNIEAIREVDDVVAGLRLTGSATSPTSEVFSEPAMSQQEAMSYLVLGRPLGEEGDSNLVGQAALSLGLAGAAPVTQTIGDTLGLQDFAVESEGQGTDTQVVASGSLTDKLSVRYGVGVFEPANQLALRYDLTKRLYLEAVSGFASSLDFFYRIDF
ncbi:MAG: translocation/assembly module TamB domain-containing protein [Halopseudomonas sp.]|uniref:translocation/assembly module TamB domain-containing protein n=1 Tax=Halopseudomonas sp. TaxID=2901191 RepID=UPI0030020925